jgi:integrase/recombinase XerD
MSTVIEPGEDGANKVRHIPDTIEMKNRTTLTTLYHQWRIEQIESQAMCYKAYSQNTIATYSEALKSFLVFYREKPVAKKSLMKT